MGTLVSSMPAGRLVPCICSFNQKDPKKGKVARMLSEEEVKSAVAGGRRRQKQGEGARAKLRSQLRSRAERNKL